MKTNADTKKIFLIIPRNEVNSPLVNVLVEDIYLSPVIGHSETVRPDTHLNRSGLHSNKFYIIVFPTNISRYLLA